MNLEAAVPGRYILVMSESHTTSPSVGQAEVLSLAEAADWVGVSHMALRSALESNQVQLLAGRKAERVVRLVRVADLREVFPDTYTRQPPKSGAVVETRVDATWLESISLGRPRPRLRKPQTSPVAPLGTGPDGEGTDEVGTHWVRPHTPGVQQSPQPARYLREQLDRSRAQVAAAKGENELLQQELLTSSDAIKKWLECASPDPSRVPAPLPAQSPGRASTAAMGNPFRVPTVPIAVRAAQGASRARVKRQLRHRMSLVAGIALVGAGLLGGRGIVDGLGWGQGGSEPRDPALADAKTGSVPGRQGSEAGGQLSPQGPSQQAGVLGVLKAGRAPADPFSTPVAEAPEVHQPGASHSPPEAAPVRMSQPPGLADLSGASSAAVLGAGGEVCMYFPLTRAGMEGRELLGPCQGAWSASLGGIVATHRRSFAGGEHATCRHHSFFDQALGGSLERARDQARVASIEGWLPPLLLLRVERCAAELLREEVPVWMESGFESGLLGEGHTIEPLDGPDQFLVQSWVRYLDFAGVEINRRFQLALALGDGPRGDSLLRLEWADD